MSLLRFVELVLNFLNWPLRKSAIELLDLEIERTAQAQGELLDGMSRDVQVAPSGRKLDFTVVRSPSLLWQSRDPHRASY